MRISTGYQFESYAGQVSASQARLFEAQRAVSSGKRIDDMADDVVGGRVLLSYRSLKSGVEQYTKNLEMAKGFLGYTEEALTSSSDLLRRGYELAIRGASDATDQVGRAAMVNEVTDLQKRLVELANSQGPTGQFIFGGQKTNARPYMLAGTNLTYTGDANSINVEVGPVETLVANSAMSATFTGAYADLEALKSYLQGGDVASLSGVSIPAMKARLEELTQERGKVGTKLQSVEAMVSNNARRADAFTGIISDVEDVDLTEAIMQYKRAENAYSAALQVAASGYGLSLMDFIRGQ